MWLLLGSKFSLVQCSWSWKCHKMKCFYKLAWKSFKNRVWAKVSHTSRLEWFGKICRSSWITYKDRVLYSSSLGSPGFFTVDCVNFRVGNIAFCVEPLRIILSLRILFEDLNYLIDNISLISFEGEPLQRTWGSDYHDNLGEDWRIRVVLSVPWDSCFLQSFFESILLVLDILTVTPAHSSDSKKVL